MVQQFSTNLTNNNNRSITGGPNFTFEFYLHRKRLIDRANEGFNIMRLNDVLSKATTVNLENYGQESVHANSILYTMYIYIKQYR